MAVGWTIFSCYLFEVFHQELFISCYVSVQLRMPYWKIKFTKQRKCSYNSVMAVERLVVMDQLLTTHFMSKCYTVLFHLWTLSGLQKNWWGLAWMSSQLRIIGSIQQQHDRVRGLGSTLQFEIITTPQVRVFTLWLIKISKNLNYTILLDTSQNWLSNMSICDLNEKKLFLLIAVYSEILSSQRNITDYTLFIRFLNWECWTFKESGRRWSDVNLSLNG